MLRFKVGDQVILARPTVANGLGRHGIEEQHYRNRKVLTISAIRAPGGYDVTWGWHVFDDMLDPIRELTPFESMVNEYIRSELT